jgi:hypothetical protein
MIHLDFPKKSESKSRPVGPRSSPQIHGHRRRAKGGRRGRWSHRRVGHHRGGSRRRVGRAAGCARSRPYPSPWSRRHHRIGGAPSRAEGHTGVDHRQGGAPHRQGGVPCRVEVCRGGAPRRRVECHRVDGTGVSIGVRLNPWRVGDRPTRR